MKIVPTGNPEQYRVRHAFSLFHYVLFVSYFVVVTVLLWSFDFGLPTAVQLAIYALALLIVGFGGLLLHSSDIIDLRYRTIETRMSLLGWDANETHRLDDYGCVAICVPDGFDEEDDLFETVFVPNSGAVLPTAVGDLEDFDTAIEIGRRLAQLTQLPFDGFRPDLYAGLVENSR